MTPRDEAEAMLDLYEGDLARTMDMLSAQLNIVKDRAQVLIGLASVVITVTGFSGRLIAGTSRPAQALVVAGLLLVLASAVYLFARIMPLRWITGEIEGAPVDALTRILGRRNRKTRAYAVGGALLCLGLSLYIVALALMLLDPAPVTVPVR